MPKSTLLLFIEDDYLVALSTRAALDAGGYTVLSVEAGPEAIRLLDEGIQAFAELTSDIRLGNGPDGREIAHHARTLTCPWFTRRETAPINGQSKVRP